MHNATLSILGLLCKPKERDVGRPCGRRLWRRNSLESNQWIRGRQKKN